MRHTHTCHVYICKGPDWELSELGGQNKNASKLKGQKWTLVKIKLLLAFKSYKKDDRI